MSTSGTYNFADLQNNDIVIDSFERIGILPDQITAQMLQSATRSLNLLLSEWINRGPNQWTMKQEILNLIPNQNTYNMPIATSAIMEATIRTSQRPLGGTAFSSAGGIAQNAFSNNPAIACTQTAPNGYISYDYGTNNVYAIAMVGVQSFATNTYTLVAEYSLDGINWFNSITMPAQVYSAGQTIWFVPLVPTIAEFYRVRETGGATLNIAELFFNTSLVDIPISPISRSEWISYPNKNQTGRPTSFYFNRQINPTVTLWPVPIAPYYNMFYTRTEEMQDIGSLTNMPEIPQRFFEALSAGLAWKLATKYLPTKAQLLKEQYEDAFNLAAREDIERVPMRVFGNYLQGWGRPL